ncbi:MAG: hypothetical protein ABL962_19725, partial [Fimbriimonadaceae bacterium]
TSAANIRSKFAMTNPEPPRIRHPGLDPGSSCLVAAVAETESRAKPRVNPGVTGIEVLWRGVQVK